MCIYKLMLELEIQIEMQDLKKMGLTTEEILTHFNFGNWFDDDKLSTFLETD